VSTANAQLKASEEKKQSVEKEQEDLLVLLDELSDKRKRDKAKMRQAGLEVSDDDEEEDDEEEEEDDDDDE
jgi:intracellular protein transport protein USO1